MNNKLSKVKNNNYLLNVISKISTMLIGFLTSMFSARYLGVVNKGIYSYISKIAGIGVIVGNMGLYQSYSFNYKKLGKDTLKKYSDLFFLQFLFYLAIAVAVTFFVKERNIVLAVLLIPFDVLKRQYENVVLIENMRLRMFLHVFNQALLTLAYAMLFFFADSNVVYIVALTIFVDAFTVGFYLIKLRYLPKIWHADFSFLKEIIKFGFLPMVSLLLVTINYSVDIFFLEALGTPEELGQYSFAVTIINYVWMLPDAFKEVLFSKSARKFDKENIKLSTQISLLAMLCCLIGFAVLGKFLINIVYGAEYLPSYGVVLVLITGAFPMGLFKLLGVVLVSQGKRGMHFITLAISAVVNIVINILTIPHWGMYGAAWASVASYSVCGIVLTAYFCKLYHFRITELLIPSPKAIKTIFSKLKKKA